MATNLKFLNGFFFYQILARKLLINKFIFLAEKHIPDIAQLSLSFLTNQKQAVINDSVFFSVLSVFEFLTNVAPVVEKCDEVKLDHFTKLRNVKISASLSCFKKYDFFLNMHCFWFQGLYKTAETYTTYNKRKSNVEKTNVEYLRYNAPVYSKKSQKRFIDESSYFRTIEWNDFTFCNFIPVELTNNIMQQKINIQISFNSKKTNQINLLLSSLNFHHRIK